MGDTRSISSIILSSVQLLSCVRLFVTSWTAARQASLSFTVSLSLLKPMLIESVMPSNHLILCRPLLLLPSIFPSIKVFTNESSLHIKWPKYWSFSFSISPSPLQHLSPPSAFSSQERTTEMQSQTFYIVYKAQCDLTSRHLFLHILLCES